MDEDRFRILGRTGLKVERLGAACSYGAPTAAFEEAFELGLNYFYGLTCFMSVTTMFLMRWILKYPARHDTGAKNAV
jgi:hypothetical protein